MPERLTSISKARANLPRLSQSAQKRLDRYIITLQGQPQSVLIGYDEYRSMKAAVELMQRPDIVEDIKAGLKELDEGKGVPMSEMKARVQQARRARETSKLAAERAAESDADSPAVENIKDRVHEKILNLLSNTERVLINEKGEIWAEFTPRGPVKTDATAHFLPPLPARYVLVKKGKNRPGKQARAVREILPPKPAKES